MKEPSGDDAADQPAPAKPGSGAQPEGGTPPTAEQPAAGLDPRGRVQSTRLSALWTGVITASALAIVFLIFITQNSEQVTVHFLWMEGRISLAVALLLSGVTGVLVVAIPGAGRIIQLRRALRKNAGRGSGHR